MRRYLLSFVSLLILLIPVVAFVSYALLFSPKTPESPVQFEIQPGTGLNQVAASLQKTGVVRNALAVKLLARWKQQTGQIQAGHYVFKNPASAEKVLDRLVQGDVEKVSLTVPEGFTLKQVIARIAEKGFGQSERLQRLATDKGFIQSLGIEANSLEGYLFPETYLFAPGIDEKALLTMMVSQFFDHTGSKFKADIAKLGLSQHQWVTLASIIEKETGIVTEMPLISSVFHNRLRGNIPLQTDPTVIYGIDDFDGNITRKHLKTPTPYNTYTTKGLPPGPIANPGLSALDAAAHPAITQLLYFVARGDGSHQFSKTLKEHNAAVRKYQLRKRK
ncbi:UPF0755 protein [Desulfuromusa kysingii]|uniref:Endolytic murein transglycosylase n=1 Tax=Desulfuromusa kysingii TaxID=37625 RepID=A0A1H4DDW2_9BACT|nr:endolytic transglycosylase MltG [Desulfuromusa kysingii]SEA70914.1 UPF0755 protein [Desulfuromusa kysingii]